MAPFSTPIYRHVSVHAALFLLFSMSATAGTINVTTTADVVGGAGTSLREAFDMANTDGMNTDIVLQSGVLYQLTCVVTGLWNLNCQLARGFHNDRQRLFYRQVGAFKIEIYSSVRSTANASKSSGPISFCPPSPRVAVTRVVRMP